MAFSGTPIEPHTTHKRPAKRHACYNSTRFATHTRQSNYEARFIPHLKPQRVAILAVAGSQGAGQPLGRQQRDVVARARAEARGRARRRVPRVQRLSLSFVQASCFPVSLAVGALLTC